MENIRGNKMEDNLLLCPECKSSDLRKLGFRHKKRKPIQQYQCKNCWRITVNPIVKEIPKRNDKGQFIRSK